jgi:Zn-dependent protease with chaperone function
MTQRDIYKAFDGKLVGRPFMKDFVCQAVSKLPDKLIQYIARNCWFLSSMEDAWAFTFTGRDIKDHHLIFLSDDLFVEETSQIQYTILHEIGHVILKHRNSILIDQTKGEIRKQEKEADEFANKYLSL